MKTATARNANGSQTRETKGDKAAMLEVVVNNPMPMAKALEVAAMAMAKRPVMPMVKALGAVVMVKTPVMPMVKALEVVVMVKTPVMPMVKALEVVVMVKTPVMPMVKALEVVVMVKTPVMPMVKALEVATMEMMDKRVGLRRGPAPARAGQTSPLNRLSGAKKT
jgi:hypothetical protein